jgi:flagellar biosynthesis protein FlhF
MPHETLRGSDLPTIFALAQERFGEGAVIHSVSRLGRGEDVLFEAVVSDAEPSRGRSRSPVPPPPAPPRRAAASGAPLVLAIVGPTGAGKSTTLAKLAAHPGVFAERRVGVIQLDTYRAGAVEQSAHLALQIGARHAVVHEERDLARARRALRGCDVILVDTAGRGPSREADEIRTVEILRALAPAEIHLALPAGLEAAHARRVAGHYRALGATHLLVTKLDEAPGGDDYAALARTLGLRRRWAASGQDVPSDLHGVVETPAPRALAPEGAAA